MPDSVLLPASDARLAGHPAGLRRTFAIISHPDAGKTTLTEKLLLFGGAIHVAGAVKARGEARRARSDWMKIEQQRGISVTTSVMHFEYGGAVFNLLDTPGHEDFSEDTYRTLTAVDSAVMVIDAAKGIEARTRKLFEICRLRDVPIITFINKMDRESRDPIELLDEIASTLALDVTPMSWPAGSGQSFKGTYDLAHNRMLLFDVVDANACAHRRGHRRAQAYSIAAPEQYAKLAEDVELVRAAYPAFDMESYRAGHLTPVFFGSAYNNFGVRELLDALAAWAPPPRPQPAEPRPIEPTEPKVTGFVFKVQANMDPNHRDRIAFLRLCSGQFRRGMKLTQMGTGKVLSVNSPILFFAREREIVDEAWPGDIIGIPNHGVLRVGDTLTEGETVKIVGIPNFAPEILRRVRLEDPMKSKQLKARARGSGRRGRHPGVPPRDRRRPYRGRGGRAAARRAQDPGRGRIPGQDRPRAGAVRDGALDLGRHQGRPRGVHVGQPRRHVGGPRRLAGVFGAQRLGAGLRRRTLAQDKVRRYPRALIAGSAPLL